MTVVRTMMKEGEEASEREARRRQAEGERKKRRRWPSEEGCSLLLCNIYL